MSVFVDSTTAAVIVDVVGFVAPDGQRLGSYVPLAQPVRAADRRQGQGMSAGRRTGDTAVRLPASVPAEATAVVLNVTSVGADRSGYVTAYATGAQRPGTSNVNFGAGTVQANEVLTAIGADRQVTLHVGGSNSPSSQLVVDVVGYLLPSDRR